MKRSNDVLYTRVPERFILPIRADVLVDAEWAKDQKTDSYTAKLLRGTRNRWVWGSPGDRASALATVGDTICSRWRLAGVSRLSAGGKQPPRGVQPCIFMPASRREAQ